jgi:hydrogenase expression/formation protein HypE
MRKLEEGKIPWDLLSNLTELCGFQDNPGIIQEAAPGIDVAALNLQEIITYIQEFYKTSTMPYLIYKADPITFPTPNPAKYLIAVNMNDLATCGAIPYGITLTLLLPPDTLRKEVLKFQKKLSEICEKEKISILGGHSEVTPNVSSPIYSASMIGFVPSEYYIPRNPKPGDKILCSGWVAAEGTGILISSNKKFFSGKLSEKEILVGTKIGENISITERVLSLNRERHDDLNLIHDATEGGILGALYECLSPHNLGCEIDSSKIPISNVTLKITQLLDIDPFRLISSGVVIIICTPERASSILDYLTSVSAEPAKIIGTITDENSPMNFDGNLMGPPLADELIKGLRNLINYT